MSRDQVTEAINRIREFSDLSSEKSGVEDYRFSTTPPISWNKQSVEEIFDVTVPPDLEVFWNLVSSVHLFMYDPSPENTGILILSPDNLVRAQEDAFTLFFPRDFRAGDLVIGVHHVLHDFYIVLRCDPLVEDYGFVFVTQEMDQRHEWVYAATSLGGFLHQYLDAVGQEYWHTGTEPHVRS